ncbi:MAG: ABC transporter permease [Gemmatimonadales bacterium]
MNELRYAIRGLLRAPGFTVVVDLSLGVGIGATTTAYSWVDSFLINPLPGVTASNRLASVHTQGPGGATWSVSYPRFQDWRAAGRPFDQLAVRGMGQFSIRTDGYGPERAFGEQVSGNFFEVLGVRTIAGRPLTLADEAAAAPVVVISETTWERAFRRDPQAIGRQILINGSGFTVVGVLPRVFRGSTAGLSFDIWLPVTTVPILDPGNTSLTQDGWQWLNGLIRLGDGVTLAQITAGAETVSGQVSKAKGDETPVIAGIESFAESGAGRFVRPLFLTLFGLAAVILLIACANIANLQLVRAVRRSKELSLRLSLGADRWRLIRQLMTESLVLAVMGGLTGLLVTSWARGLLAALMPALPYPINLTGNFNLRVVALSAVATIGTAMLVGLVPAIRSSRPSLVTSLKDATPTSARSWLRSSLVVAQVSLSLVALVAAGLFIRSLSAARTADPGFHGADRVLVAGTSFQFAGMNDSTSAASFDRMLEALRAVPGVTLASLTTDLPLSLGGHSSSTNEPEGYQPSQDENMSVERALVGPDYFEAMGIRLIAGRGFTVNDRTTSPLVTVVNQAYVDRFWPRRDPIGATLRTNGRTWTVIGVAPNVTLERIGEQPIPYNYFPVSQRLEAEFSLVLKTSVEPRSLIEPVRAALQSIDPNLPVLDPRSMAEHAEAGMFIQSTGARLLAGLGLLALALAALGLYGVLSFSVSQRTREIGIRVALGALTGQVVRLVVGQATRLVAVGIAVGTGLALAVANLLRQQLFGVQPADPVTFTAVALLLVAVAVGAAAMPARRAARVDPVGTLKAD